jgi:hypothetical protein
VNVLSSLFIEACFQETIALSSTCASDPLHSAWLPVRQKCWTATRVSLLMYVSRYLENFPVILARINERHICHTIIPSLHIRSYLKQPVTLPANSYALQSAKSSNLSLSTSKFEFRSFQSAQAFSGSDVPAPVRIGEILQQASDFPNLATLKSLTNVATQAVLLLIRNRARRQKHDCALDPLRRRFRHELEESEQDAASIRETVLRSCSA